MSSSDRPRQNTPELLGRLVDAGVELVVVGGIAAVAHGSEQFTKDIDIVAPFTVENIQRLMAVVQPLAPRFYQTIGKPLVQRAPDDLAAFKNLYLQTDLGVLDVLGSVPPVGDYSNVVSRAVEMSLFGRRCKVISLDDLIAIKSHVGRAKDKLVEAELRAIRERLSG